MLNSLIYLENAWISLNFKVGRELLLFGSFYFRSVIRSYATWVDDIQMDQLATKNSYYFRSIFIPLRPNRQSTLEDLHDQITFSSFYFRKQQVFRYFQNLHPFCFKYFFQIIHNYELFVSTKWFFHYFISICRLYLIRNCLKYGRYFKTALFGVELLKLLLHIKQSQ